MERPENNKWLDEALTETIGSEKSRTDFEQWKRQHPDAVKMLTSRAGKKVLTSTARFKTRRTIMTSTITKLAAAVIIITVFLVLYLTNGTNMTNVVLGEVLQNVENMKFITYKHTVSSVTNSGTPEETSDDTERTSYISTEHGLRHDVFKDGQLTGILYIPSSGIDVTYVMPVKKQYMVVTMSEEFVKENSQVSPTGIIKEFMSYEYTRLGTKQIDGIEAEGIEINEPGFYGFESTVGRLWIDTKANLPVRMEIEGIRGATESTIITYDYNWDAELDQNIFNINIPDDYTLVEE
jgi:hypothetical protein